MTHFPPGFRGPLPGEQEIECDVCGDLFIQDVMTEVGTKIYCPHCLYFGEDDEC